MANSRFQSNGVDHMIDGLVAANVPAGDVREHMWRVAWARGYQDILTPIAVPDLKIEGFCVFSRTFGPGHTMVLIDDHDQLIGVVDEIDIPPNGAKVRLQPLYSANARWGVKMLATLGCGLQIRFDEDHSQPGWTDRLKAALATIREGEVALRRRVEQERSTITFVLPPTPFRQEMEQADKDLRDKVTAGGYTDDEQRALARAGSNKDAVAKVIAARDKRLVDAYRVEVAAFRERIPELRADYDRRMAEYEEFRTKIDRCNEIDSASRGVTDSTLRATQLLETIETAALNVRAVDMDRIEADPRRALTEIIQTVDLLFELLPKSLQKTAASGAR